MGPEFSGFLVLGHPENFSKAFAIQEISDRFISANLFGGGKLFATEKGFPLLSLVQKYRSKTITNISLKTIFVFYRKSIYERTNKLFLCNYHCFSFRVIIGGVVHTQFPENTESFSKKYKTSRNNFHQISTDDYRTIGFHHIGCGNREMGYYK